MGEKLIVGVDVGGTNLVAAAVSAAGERRPSSSRPTPAALDAAALDELAALVREAAGGDPGAVGLGLPGPLDRAGGRLLDPPNLPGWNRVPLRDELAKRLNAPVALENDANCAALGEWWLGAGREVDDLVLLTLGTGIGGGIVSGGRLLTGADGRGGEVGHLTVQPDGERCACGSRGCLETLASATAVARRASERLGREVTAAEVHRAAAGGDERARAVLAEAGRWLGIGVASLTSIFNPRLVILTGGLAGALDFLKPALLAEVEARVMPALRENLAVGPGALGGDAGAVGAARAAMEI